VGPAGPEACAGVRPRLASWSVFDCTWTTGRRGDATSLCTTSPRRRGKFGARARGGLAFDWPDHAVRGRPRNRNDPPSCIRRGRANAAAGRSDHASCKAVWQAPSLVRLAALRSHKPCAWKYRHPHFFHRGAWTTRATCGSCADGMTGIHNGLAVRAGRSSFETSCRWVQILLSVDCWPSHSPVWVYCSCPILAVLRQSSLRGDAAQCGDCRKSADDFRQLPGGRSGWLPPKAGRRRPRFYF